MKTVVMHNINEVKNFILNILDNEEMNAAEFVCDSTDINELIEMALEYGYTIEMKEKKQPGLNELAVKHEEEINAIIDNEYGGRVSPKELKAIAQRFENKGGIQMFKHKFKLTEGQKVFVYYNLHKQCFSVRDEKTKRVVAHVQSIQLTNVTFKVSTAGRERVLKEKRKNVHAGVQGFYSFEPIRREDEYEEATYNPYFYSSFVNKHTEEPLKGAEFVELWIKQIFYIGGK